MYIVQNLTVVQCSQPLSYVHCTISYTSAVQSTLYEWNSSDTELTMLSLTDT